MTEIMNERQKMKRIKEQILFSINSSKNLQMNITYQLIFFAKKFRKILQILEQMIVSKLHFSR